MLALQAVLLVGKVLVHVVVLASSGAVGLSGLNMLLQSLLVHLAKCFNSKLDVSDQSITSASAEIFSDDDTHHLELACVGSHGVSGNDPSTLTKLVCNGELVKLVTILGVEAESNERKTVATSLRHENETKLLNGCSKVVRSAGKVDHDGTETTLSKTDELVVLADNLRGTTGEVEGERGLVSAEVVDVEDELLGEVLGVTPDAPTNTGVDLDSVSEGSRLRV